MNDTTFQGDGEIAFVPVVVNAKQQKQTNADRIRAMTDEELARQLAFLEDFNYDEPRVLEWLDWLKQEAMING